MKRLRSCADILKKPIQWQAQKQKCQGTRGGFTPATQLPREISHERAGAGRWWNKQVWDFSRDCLKGLKKKKTGTDGKRGKISQAVSKVGKSRASGCKWQQTWRSQSGAQLPINGEAWLSSPAYLPEGRQKAGSQSPLVSTPQQARAPGKRAATKWVPQ